MNDEVSYPAKSHENYIRINEEQFYNYFKGYNYVKVSWMGKSKDIPDPPYWEAHLDWVFDKNTQTYVGYETSSSWYNDGEYAILEEIASPEMVEWNTIYQVEEQTNREKWEKEVNEAYTRNPRSFDPTEPGLMEFLDEGDVIEYNASTAPLDAWIEDLKENYKR